MEYNITPSVDGTYILIKSRGDMNRVSAIKQNIEAHVLGKQLGIHRFLTDLRESRNVETVVDDFEFAYEDMQNEPVIDRFARVALLVSPDDHSHDFIVTVVVNAGMNVHLFTDLEKALQFLMLDRR